jgi:hypothetical protein
MSNFGQTLFGGSLFVRISLTPFLLLFAVIMPLAIQKWTPTGVAILVVLELVSIALLLGFWLPSRHRHWAFRGVAGLVFLGYGGYLIYEVLFTNMPFKLPQNRAESSPFNALRGLIFIGLPCLWYAVFGRFKLWTSKPDIKGDSRKGDAHANDDNNMSEHIPKVNRDDVRRIILREFQSHGVDPILGILDGYGAEEWQQGKERVQLAILKVSGGDIDRLRELVDTACYDFRDVVAPAEYPRFWAIGLVAAEKMSDEEKKRLIEDDWRQYQEWLNRE